MRTRVKICGITSQADVLHVAATGADAIGLVFYEKSPRFVSLSEAAKISDVMPVFVSRVALFKDANEHLVQSVLDNVAIEVIQFHGRESVDFCESFNKPYIKAMGVKGVEKDVDYLISQIEAYPSAKAFLLDGHAPGEAGGAGDAFAWSDITAAMAAITKPVILAGGLNVKNVRQAIEAVHPFAVDVSSGVESSPGIKDQDKIAEFVRQVNLADIGEVSMINISRTHK